VVASLEEAFAAVQSSVSSAVSGAETSPSKAFVIGGGQIYAQAINDADRLVITHVHTVIEDADTFFPEIDAALWTVVERSEMQTDPETGYDFEFLTYEKR
jgi:dihydrofolate reductase